MAFQLVCCSCCASLFDLWSFGMKGWNVIIHAVNHQCHIVRLGQGGQETSRSVSYS